MEGLLNFIFNILPDSRLEYFYHTKDDGLSDAVVVQSVQEASDFFNLNAPMEVYEDKTTGVMTGLDFTENDDILVFSREQMQQMGITDKEGFDLVMTHEGAHRALQDLHTDFTPRQEELCCDYMAGVRAGLNSMDWSKMKTSLANTVESETHPGGLDRIEAIEEGVAFAHDYMLKHGKAPAFNESLKHFEQLHDKHA